MPQGLLWRVADHEWIGRLLSATFATLLVAAVWQLARQISTERPARDLVPPLAMLGLLTSAVFAGYAAAGMTDVPVTAPSAATAVVLWSSVLRTCSCGSRPLERPRRSSRSLPGFSRSAVSYSRQPSCAGAQRRWQAARLDVGLVDLLRTGNDDFWQERGAAARFDAIAGGAWLGQGARILAISGVAHAIARTAGAGARVALAVAARTCSELKGARFFSYLSSGESLEFAQLQHQPTDPLACVQCTHPQGAARG